MFFSSDIVVGLVGGGYGTFQQFLRGGGSGATSRTEPASLPVYSISHNIQKSFCVFVPSPAFLDQTLKYDRG